MRSTKMASSSSFVFKMPQEPKPLPSLEADEDSFVVLGKSIPDFYSDESISNQLDVSVISEAKILLNKEIEALDSIKPKEEGKKKSNDSSIMETSTTTTALPSMPAIENGLESTNTISIASFSPDMSSEEVQTKISQIIEENVHLKDTILQNNMTLKSQYEKITAWQKDVQRVHETHKEKLLEAKNIIKNLTLEKERLANIAKEKDILEMEIVKLKEEIREKDAVRNETLQQRSTDNMKEFQLDVANKKIKDLEEECKKLMGINEQMKNESTDLYTQYKNRCTELEKQMEELSIKEAENQKKCTECEGTQHTIEVLKHQLSEQSKTADALTTTINSLRAQVVMKDEEIENMRTQLSELQTNLTQVEFTRTQAYSQVQRLTEQLSKAKDEVDSKDELMALKIQLAIYKNDFEEERQARETIKDEKDRIEMDVQNLQRRNQQLQEEIELLRSNTDFVTVPNRPSPSRSENSHPTSRYRCPKCFFGFKNITELEAHVQRCIDLDDSIP